MERWGVTSQSCDPVGRFCRHVDRPHGNDTASTRSLRPAPDTSDLSTIDTRVDNGNLDFSQQRLVLALF